MTLDLAPVADLPCPADRDDNPPVAGLERNYGWTPASVASGVGAFTAGMREAGVATTVKHFPGLGCVTANTDTAAEVVDDSTDASSVSLGGFRAGIAAGASVVMVSSAEYTRLDPGVPALFSPRIVTGLLRQQLGFTGLVMSDDVGSASTVPVGAYGSGPNRAISAGSAHPVRIRDRPGRVPRRVGASPLR